MALLDIVLYPDPILKQRAEEVQSVDDGLRKLLDDMAETMYEAPGIGLAAPQIGESKRVIVVDVGMDEETGEASGLLKLVNPEIISATGKISGEEGCLSIPDVRETVTRSEIVKVRALNEQGEPIELEASGLLSICLQHEIDHLDGILFIDLLSRVRKELVRGKLNKLRKAAK